MPDVTMKARELLGALEVLGRLLIIHSPLPASADGGATARAGIRLRRLKRAASEAAEDVQAQMEGVRGRGDKQQVSEAVEAILGAPVVLSVPELLTRADWDAIPQSAPHLMPNTGTDGQPVTVTLRKTEADLDTLGALVVDPDELGA